MYRVCARSLACCVAVLCAASPAFAQSPPTVELSAGYQFLNFSVAGENESMPKGWYFDVAGNLNPLVGIVFQVGGNYKSFEESFTLGGVTATATADLKVHEFLGGVRVNARSTNAIVPFGHVLVGAINGSVETSATTTGGGLPPLAISDEDSGTDLGLEVGGGVNFGLSEDVGLRVGVDYLRVFGEDDNSANLFRFTVGIVFGR